MIQLLFSAINSGLSIKDAIYSTFGRGLSDTDYNNILKVLYVQMPEKIECVFTKNHYCGKLTKIVF